MNKKSAQSLSGKKLVDAIVSALEESLGEKIVVIDFQGLPGSADWFIICQSDNTVHNSSLGNNVIEKLKDLNTRPWQKEGFEEGRWVLLDYSDVVVHIMLTELRSFYNLEKLWKEGVATAIN